MHFDRRVIGCVRAGAHADSGEASPPAMARRASSPSSEVVVVPGQGRCPLIPVPALVDACRRPPGLPACVAQCIVYHYRGGYCDLLPNGRPGDCFCTNCLGSGA
ncbi:hypothetical protein GQ55_1G051600 [Panicum hallii var. hallii]|uniref:Uncharacterized protein n=1 Tax=Panicum hallii var. hallii TaxID=1504633 RepID=A0A2T7F2G8_9POAL|nr:hypothetical protein GQ55_1G051600 [Panicum hallii var. hallii]